LFIKDLNPCLVVDGYKPSHWAQLPPDMKAGFGYIESRGGRHRETLFFGLQAQLAYLRQRITHEHVDEAKAFYARYYPPAYPGLFNEAGFRRIVDVHGGYWPVRICAAPEGSLIPTGNVLLSISTSDDQLPWAGGYLENRLLRSVWYPTTVCTESFMIKRVIKHFLDLTADDPDAELPFKLHDFGSRAASSTESAGLGGMAHLVNFRGTDTIEGILAAMRFYGADVCGSSIPASEHSTITAWGRAGECDAYAHMLATFGRPDGIFACVSDSYDIDNAVTNLWGGELRQRVIDSGATVVIRPDSGDPVKTPCQTVEALAESFGFTLNRKGYKVLKNVRVIQGDGVDAENIRSILFWLQMGGFSASNIAFGMGGKLLQAGIDRDTQRFAMKQSAVYRGGRWLETYKDPVGDPGKASKRGLLALTHDNDNGWETVPLFGERLQPNQLQPSYDTGWFAPPVSFEAVQKRAAAAL